MEKPMTADNSREIVVADPSDVTTHDEDHGGGGGMAMVRRALDQGASVETVERLVALAERMQEREAQRALNRALHDFRRDCPQIPKRRTTTQSGGYGYSYASLDDIERVVGPVLARHGLSYTHDSEIDGQRLVTTCYVRHVEGGTLTSTFTGPLEDSGKMSAIQKMGSATTYARRYSLISALGLTTTDHDDDGAGSVPDEPITTEQRDELQAMAEMAGADVPAFCKYLRVPSLADIPASRYAEAEAALRRKMGAK